MCLNIKPLVFDKVWYNVHMQTQKIIEQLGYSSKEAKVYLVALSLGDCHVSDISKKQIYHAPALN